MLAHALPTDFNRKQEKLVHLDFRNGLYASLAHRAAGESRIAAVIQEARAMNAYMAARNEQKCKMVPKWQRLQTDLALLCTVTSLGYVNCLADFMNFVYRIHSSRRDKGNAWVSNKCAGNRTHCPCAKPKCSDHGSASQ